MSFQSRGKTLAFPFRVGCIHKIFADDLSDEASVTQVVFQRYDMNSCMLKESDTPLLDVDKTLRLNLDEYKNQTNTNAFIRQMAKGINDAIAPTHIQKKVQSFSRGSFDDRFHKLVQDNTTACSLPEETIHIMENPDGFAKTDTQLNEFRKTIVQNIALQGAELIQHMFRLSAKFLQNSLKTKAVFKTDQGHDKMGLYRVVLYCDLSEPGFQLYHDELHKMYQLRDVSPVSRMIPFVFLVMIFRSPESKNVTDVYIKFEENVANEYYQYIEPLMRHASDTDSYPYNPRNVNRSFWTLHYADQGLADLLARVVIRSYPDFFHPLDSNTLESIWKTKKLGYEAIVKKIGKDMLSYIASQDPKYALNWKNMTDLDMRKYLTKSPYAFCNMLSPNDCSIPLPLFVRNLFNSTIKGNHAPLSHTKEVVNYFVFSFDSSLRKQNKKIAANVFSSEHGKEMFPANDLITAIVYHIIVGYCLYTVKDQIKWTNRKFQSPAYPSPWQVLIERSSDIHTPTTAISNVTGLRRFVQHLDVVLFSFVGGYVSKANDQVSANEFRKIRVCLLRMGYDDSSLDYKVFLQDANSPGLMRRFNETRKALHETQKLLDEPQYHTQYGQSATPITPSTAIESSDTDTTIDSLDKDIVNEIGKLNIEKADPFEEKTLLETYNDLSQVDISESDKLNRLIILENDELDGLEVTTLPEITIVPPLINTSESNEQKLDESSTRPYIPETNTEDEQETSQVVDELITPNVEQDVFVFPVKEVEYAYSADVFSLLNDSSIQYKIAMKSKELDVELKTRDGHKVFDHFTRVLLACTIIGQRFQNQSLYELEAVYLVSQILHDLGRTDRDWKSLNLSEFVFQPYYWAYQFDSPEALLVLTDIGLDNIIDVPIHYAYNQFHDAHPKSLEMFEKFYLSQMSSVPQIGNYHLFVMVANAVSLIESYKNIMMNTGQQVDVINYLNQLEQVAEESIKSTELDTYQQIRDLIRPLVEVVYQDTVTKYKNGDDIYDFSYLSSRFNHNNDRRTRMRRRAHMLAELSRKVDKRLQTKDGTYASDVIVMVMHSWRAFCVVSSIRTLEDMEFQFLVNCIITEPYNETLVQSLVCSHRKLHTYLWSFLFQNPRQVYEGTNLQSSEIVFVPIRYLKHDILVRIALYQSKSIPTDRRSNHKKILSLWTKYYTQKIEKNVGPKNYRQYAIAANVLFVLGRLLEDEKRVNPYADPDAIGLDIEITNLLNAKEQYEVKFVEYVQSAIQEYVSISQKPNRLDIQVVPSLRSRGYQQTPYSLLGQQIKYEQTNSILQKIRLVAATISVINPLQMTRDNRRVQDLYNMILHTLRSMMLNKVKTHRHVIDYLLNKRWSDEYITNTNAWSNVSIKDTDFEALIWSFSVYPFETLTAISTVPHEKILCVIQHYKFDLFEDLKNQGQLVDSKSLTLFKRYYIDIMKDDTKQEKCHLATMIANAIVLMERYGSLMKKQDKSFSIRTYLENLEQVVTQLLPLNEPEYDSLYLVVKDIVSWTHQAYRNYFNREFQKPDEIIYHPVSPTKIYLTREFKKPVKTYDYKPSDTIGNRLLLVCEFSRRFGNDLYTRDYRNVKDIYHLMALNLMQILLSPGFYPVEHEYLMNEAYRKDWIEQFQDWTLVSAHDRKYHIHTWAFNFGDSVAAAVFSGLQNKDLIQLRIRHFKLDFEELTWHGVSRAIMRKILKTVILDNDMAPYYYWANVLANSTYLIGDKTHRSLSGIDNYSQMLYAFTFIIMSTELVPHVETLGLEILEKYRDKIIKIYEKRIHMVRMK